MIRSMTGFGSSSVTTPLGEVGVEVKSVNNRFLDMNLKLPRELNNVELRLRDEVKRRLRRGKVDVFIRWTPAPNAQPLYHLNTALIKTYADQLRDALNGNDVECGHLLSLPGVVIPSPAVDEEGGLAEAAATALNQALDAVEQFRQREGSDLAAAIAGSLDVIAGHRAAVAEAKDDIQREHETRLRDRVARLQQELAVSVDPGRLEQELMFFADKSDITEELVRLDAHLASFRKMLSTSNGSEPVGKSMDFLVQELLRETNTIGNKARGVAVAQNIVQMKSEIEKIREQVQNLE